MQLLKTLLCLFLGIPLCIFSEDATVTHNQTITLNGETIHYTSTCGYFPLNNHEGVPIAYMFYTSYTKPENPNRPITFCFNGGPGSASTWLHMGCLGPKRVSCKESGHPLQPPSYEENPYTLLLESDLVFIDPISAGFSYTPNPEHETSFFSTSVDISSFCSFISQYIQQNHRWLSPKYVLGESYGAIRAVGIAEELFDSYYMPVDGLILISPALDYLTFTLDCNLSYLLHFPTMVATAWYHNKLDASLQSQPLVEVLKSAEAFCEEEYLPALFKGGSLPNSSQWEIAHRLSYFTGIKPELYYSSYLTLSMELFLMELLKEYDLTIGGYDSRYTGYVIGDQWNWKWYWDPSAEQVIGSFNLCFNDYLRKELGWTLPGEYKMMSNCIKEWDFEAKNSYLSKTTELATLLTLNPKLKVFFASGLYDLVTPYFASDFVINTLSIPDQVRDNVTNHYYEAGHMMYLHGPSLQKLSTDLKSFYSETLSRLYE